MDLAISIMQLIASVLVLAAALVELVRTCACGGCRRKKKH